MKLTLWLLGGLFFIGGLLAIGSQWLPNQFKVRRSVVIRSRPEKVFPLLNNLEFWQRWTTFTKEQDPSLVYIYRGPESGVGSESEWQGDKMGNGKMAITESLKNEKVGYSLFFEKGNIHSNGYLVISPVPGGSEVIWVNEGRVDRNPLMRYMAYFMDDMMGPELEKGLGKLKMKVEGTSDRQLANR